MSRDASGNYTLPTGTGLNPASDGQNITAALWNTTFNDIATALTGSVGLTAVQSPTNKTLTVANSNTVEATSGPGSTALAFRNRLHNGSILINQRALGAQVPLAANVYLADRWIYNSNQSTRYNAVATTAVATGAPGFPSYLSYTSQGAFSPAAGDWQCNEQRVEGFNIRDLAWGTANAKTVTLSFWYFSSITGTHSGAIVNGANSRSYPFTFAVNSASTWEYKSITIPGDTSGAWTVDSSIGLSVRINLGTGSSSLGTAGTWASAQYFGATGAVNISGTNGAVVQMTGFQIEPGSVATPFEYRDVGDELRRCQRYCFVWNSEGIATGIITTGQVYNAGTGSANGVLRFPIPMRSAPSITYSSITDFIATEATGAGHATTSSGSFAINTLAA